jgi:hypothetical protein
MTATRTSLRPLFIVVLSSSQICIPGRFGPVVYFSVSVGDMLAGGSGDHPERKCLRFHSVTTMMLVFRRD